jgi:hypothetical protein
MATHTHPTHTPTPPHAALQQLDTSKWLKWSVRCEGKARKVSIKGSARASGLSFVVWGVVRRFVVTSNRHTNRHIKSLGTILHSETQIERQRDGLETWLEEMRQARQGNEMKGKE